MVGDGRGWREVVVGKERVKGPTLLHCEYLHCKLWAKQNIAPKCMSIFLIGKAAFGGAGSCWDGSGLPTVQVISMEGPVVDMC